MMLKRMNILCVFDVHESYKMFYHMQSKQFLILKNLNLRIMCTLILLLLLLENAYYSRCYKLYRYYRYMGRD